ncbi:Mlp family lipoprotein (plasmid) [Borrelia miyamotoi]|uniref:Mlp family lipoprotein n=1 Tax=Borrelia miyamotoi TaxID=47466 RepID=A0A5P8AV75_9SPIR|nr:Mlp family lipoprotein [Borrelia miyamotoi]QFP42591.1 Mlp family lipoprotein [Borrelia miyamotoi]WAZ72475.1 Mlp family lipoprotein [Borrelia miyamotoi]WVI05398.1 Mlp family lipoprotein [Borrelia miyamotoi]
MIRISCILLLLVLISSCCQNEFTNNVEKKSIEKKELSEEQIVVKKTPKEILREKLSEEEKGNLNFLKEALSDNSKFNWFLSLNEGKIKSVLEHIKDQLKSCNGNEEGGKETFKAVVKGYFSKMDENTLDSFKDQAVSTCGSGS